MFEALAWTYAIDEKLAKPAQPELRGLRYARNCVHHQWSQALWMDMGTELPFILGDADLGVVSEWRWKDRLAKRRDRDQEAYEQHLAGKPARDTLTALRNYLAPTVTGPVTGITSP